MPSGWPDAALIVLVNTFIVLLNPLTVLVDTFIGHVNRFAAAPTRHTERRVRYSGANEPDHRPVNGIRRPVSARRPGVCNCPVPPPVSTAPASGSDGTRAERRGPR